MCVTKLPASTNASRPFQVQVYKGFGVNKSAFFATAGLRVDLGLLADGETIMWALIVLAIASLSKFLGSIVGAQLSFLPLREGAALVGDAPVAAGTERDPA